MKQIKQLLPHSLWCILLIISCLLLYNVYKFLPIKYLFAAALILALLLAFVIYIQFSKKTNAIVKTGSKILCVVVSIFIVFVNIKVLDKAQETIEKISNGNVQTTTISILVKRDSQYQNIKELKGKQFGILKNIDQDNTNFILNRLYETYQEEIFKTEYSSSDEMLTDLLNGKLDAIIMNEGFRESFELIDEHFETETRVIYTIDREEVLDNLKSASVTKESFLVYISGIDVSGAISRTSRSDVNMLMAVNPVKKKISLVFIPRDYYVALQCPNGSCQTGAMDKLTHAGLYGIETSQATIENFMGVSINYHIRINFDTLKTMVDALNGIDITSDQDVTLRHGEGCNIRQGVNHVDGRCALGFARERYAYAAGDRHRGENQQEVIRAMVNKLTTTNIISHFESILNAIQGMFQTNMTSDEITALIQMQINDMALWDIQSALVDGTGELLPTYSYGSTPLYVMRPDQSTIQEAQALLKATLE